MVAWLHSINVIISTKLFTIDFKDCHIMCLLVCLLGLDAMKVIVGRALFPLKLLPIDVSSSPGFTPYTILKN